MRQVGILRGPDEFGNVLILPTAARYSATYDQEGPDASPRKTPAKAKAKLVKGTLLTALPGLEEET